MTLFSASDKLYYLINSNYHLLPVLNRFGIRLGIRDKTISDICNEKNINISFFLAVVNTFNNPDYFPEQELLSCSPLELVRYLKKTHQYYIQYIVPKLDFLIERMIKSSTPGFQGLQMVDVFYKKYKRELFQHLEYEDHHVFPHVEKLIDSGAYNSNFSIQPFHKEHSNIEEKLNDLRNLLIKYLLPEYDDYSCNEFLLTLALFEKDLEDHARIEDKILVPLVAEIEKRIKKGPPADIES